MTTINDIQDLVQIINHRPEWRRELQSALLIPDLRDTASLITETAKLVAKNSEAIAANADAIDKHAEGIAANIKSIAANADAIDKNAKSIEKLDTSTKRLTDVAGLHSGHIGDMRGLFISQKVVREAVIIADDMGLTFVGTLEPKDILNIWNAGKAKGLTDGISRDDERSFKLADLIIEAKADDGAQCFIAVEISFTIDERDTDRAIRNAKYITNFIETPTYAAVAGVSKDNRIDGVLADMPEPHASDQETRVFWSRHEEIEKPN